MLVSVGGLPATGKTTVSRGIARRLRAAYVRLDTLEVAIARAEGAFADTNRWELPAGYLAAYQLAADQLALGLDVVAESVNPLDATRDAWRDVAEGTGARLLEVEVVCSNPVEHRRRAETRVLDLEGLTSPTWQQITERGYHPWARDHLVLDTALLDVETSVHRVLTALD